MKTLKRIGFIILVIVVLPFIAALFIPKTYTISVSETINKPRQQVFEYMRMLKNQKEYNTWVMEDPDLHIQITGTDGSIGAIQQWNSKIDHVGEGEQEITSLSPEKIDFALRFKRPMKGVASVSNRFMAKAEDKTEVTSEFHSFAQYPMNLPAYVFGRKMIKEALMKNLQNLKHILESSRDMQADMK